MNKRQRRVSIVSVMVFSSIAFGAAVFEIVSSQGGDAALVSLPDQVRVPSLDITTVYDPESAGEPMPHGYRQLLGRDQIQPVYDPAFTTADEVDWPLDSLVIGVAGSETAKAYPVTHLNQREMVIDHLEGLPILVSW